MLQNLILLLVGCIPLRFSHVWCVPLTNFELLLNQKKLLNFSLKLFYFLKKTNKKSLSVTWRCQWFSEPSYRPVDFEGERKGGVKRGKNPPYYITGILFINLKGFLNSEEDDWRIITRFMLNASTILFLKNTGLKRFHWNFVNGICVDLTEEIWVAWQWYPMLWREQLVLVTKYSSIDEGFV